MAKRRGNREGTIYERKDGRWCGQIAVAGSRKTVYGSTQQEVQDKILKLRNDLHADTADWDVKMTVGELAGQWLYLVRHTLAGSSVKRYRAHLQMLTAVLEDIQVRQLTTLHVGTLYATLEKQGVSAADRLAVGKRFRQILAYACSTGHAATNVARLVPLPRVQREEIRPLQPHEIQLFLDVARSHRLFALFLLALDTGARIGELVVLEQDDWNATARTVRFVKTFDELSVRDVGEVRPKESKTKASRRTVRVTEITAAAIDAQLSRCHGGLLFSTQTGGYYWPCELRLVFKRLLRKAGLPASVRFHDLRHTCATALLLAGVDVKTVAARLGHANATTTLQTYAHVLPAGEEHAVEATSRYLQ